MSVKTQNYLNTCIGNMEWVCKCTMPAIFKISNDLAQHIV